MRTCTNAAAWKVLAIMAAAGTCGSALATPPSKTVMPDHAISKGETPKEMKIDNRPQKVRAHEANPAQIRKGSAVSATPTQRGNLRGPGNDDCSGAVPLTGGFPIVVNGDTTGSTVEFDSSDCFYGGSHFGPGVWYSFVGNGHYMEATLCNGTFYDSMLHVYEGGCGFLGCVGGDDDGCGVGFGPSVVRWTAQAGVTYYILVNGYDAPDFGQFNLTLNDLGAPQTPANDECSAATPVSVGSSVSGATVFANPDFTEDCMYGGTTDSPGVWYALQGNGNILQASVCGADYDSMILVYDGCGFASCVAADDDGCGIFAGPSEVNFVSQAGVTYYIQVTGYGTGNSGSFTLNIADLGQPATNDFCNDAVPVTIGTLVSGTTVGSSLDTDAPASCGPTSVTTPGVWYSVVGNGTTLTADVCAFADYDTKIHVYSGSCGALQCIGSNDDFCGLQSSVSWCSEMGTTYYILVSGFGGATGNFDFIVNSGSTCEPPVPPANDNCANATTVTIGSVTPTDTRMATSDTGTAPACGPTSVGAPGVWYRLTGNGDTLTADLCSAARTYDTKIHVYSGSCGALACIDSNDDFCGLGSSVTWCSEAGVDYYILVNGFGTGVGTAELTITSQGPCVPPVRPANDDCINAEEIVCDGSGTTILTADITLATNEANEPNFSCIFAGPGPGVGSVWYRFVAGSTSVTFDTCATTDPVAADSVLGLYTGTCGNLVEIACSEDVAGCLATGFGSSISYSGLTIGETYYIKLAAFADFRRGTYTLTFQGECGGGDTCPADFNNDNAVNASDITAFLSAWFADRAGGTLNADFNNSGAVDASDITAFLSAWFADRASGNC